MIEAILAGVVWYLAITVAGVISFPITFAVCRGLTDRGVSIYRPIGLLVATLPIWFAGNLAPIPYTSVSLIVAAMVVGIVAWTTPAMRGGIHEFVGQNWKRIAIFEVITACLFFGYLVLRGYNAAVLGTEKPMELAFLSATIRADALPVPDPWFAGETINYYYFGFVMVGSVAKIIGATSGVAFNLGLATTFALAAVAAAGLAAEIASRLPSASVLKSSLASALGAFFLVFAGNMHAPVELIRDPRNTVHAGWWDGIGWGSSRVIEDSGFVFEGTRAVITEFPAFSWILGDLHPHVLAYPWLIASFALSLNLLNILARRPCVSGLIPASVASGALIAVLYSSNTWDAPIALLVTVVALAIASSGFGVRRVIASAVVVAATALMLAIPFALHYTSAAGDPTATGTISRVPALGALVDTVGFVDWDRTSVSELLTVHGGFWVLILLIGLVAWLSTPPAQHPQLAAIAVTAGMLAVGSIITSTPALLVIGVPLAAIAWLARQSFAEASRAFGLALICIAFLAILSTEFVYIRDPFGDRMNTVFKVYFQVWALLAISVAALLPGALSALHRLAGKSLFIVATLGLVLVGLAMSVYTPISAYRWYDEFDAWRELDGIEYAERANPAEAAAIDWLRNSAAQESVILEAPGCAYGADHGLPHNRFSMATGIPTVLGWDGHQRQWRRQQPERINEIPARVEHVRAIYEEPASQQAANMRDHYGVTHIIVGSQERAGYARCELGPPYSQEGLEQLAEIGWRLAFELDDIQIFVRPDDGEAN